MHGHSNVDHHDLCKLEVVLRDYNFSLWPADILEFHQLSVCLDNDGYPQNHQLHPQNHHRHHPHYHIILYSSLSHREDRRKARR